MMAKGHMLLAANITLASFIYFPESLKYIDDTNLFLGAVLLGSVFPDIDERGSYINRKFPILMPISYLFKHRTITHFFISFIAFFTIALLIDDVYKDFFLGFSIGWLLHTVGDMLTISGIKGYFFPFLEEKRVHLLPSFLRFRTGGFVENILIVGMSIILVLQVDRFFL